MSEDTDSQVIGMRAVLEEYSAAFGIVAPRIEAGRVIAEATERGFIDTAGRFIEIDGRTVSVFSLYCDDPRYVAVMSDAGPLGRAATPREAWELADRYFMVKQQLVSVIAQACARTAEADAP